MTDTNQQRSGVEKDEDITTNSKPLVSIPKIRTFSNDVQNAVKDGNFSQVNIAMAEKKRARYNGEELDENNTKHKKSVGLTIGYIFVILLFVAGGAGIFIFFQSNRNAANSSFSQQNNSLGFFSDAQELQLLIEDSDNRPEIVQKINNLSSKIGTGDFVKIVPTRLVLNEEGERADTKISLEDFFERLLISDDGFARLTDVYVYGIHAGKHPFLLIQLEDPVESYARLFSWERRMQVDLLPFFPALNEERGVLIVENTESVGPTESMESVDSDAVSSGPEDQTMTQDDESTDSIVDQESGEDIENIISESSVGDARNNMQEEAQFIYNPRAALFSDGVFFNFEGRVVRDSENKVRLIYALITKDLLVITSNPETLRSISLELKSTSIVR